MVDPEDENYHNGGLRSAVRHSGPADMDPSAYLVGLASGVVSGPPGGAEWATAADDRTLRAASQGAGRQRFR